MIKAIALSTVFAVVSVVSFAQPVGASKTEMKSSTKGAKTNPLQSPKGQGLCPSLGCVG